MDKVNPWRRYRLNRIFKLVVFTIIAGPGPGLEVGHHVLGGHRRGPRAVLRHPVREPGGRAAAVLHADHHGHVRPVQPADLLRHLHDRRHRDLQGGRDQDPLPGRLGPGPGAAQGPGEHRLPGEAGRDRGQGRLRPERHPAVGAAGHRQDADGRGGRRRDRQAVRLRRSVGVRADVHRRGADEDQVAVPQAAQAGAALRRRRRVLRRGRRPRQPGLDQLGRPVRHPAGARGGRRAAQLQRPSHYVDDQAALHRLARPAARRRRRPAHRRARTRSPRSGASSWAAWAWAAAWARCRPCSPRCPASRSRAGSSAAACARSCA